jgi:hypothetical protein
MSTVTKLLEGSLSPDLTLQELIKVLEKFDSRETGYKLAKMAVAWRIYTGDEWQQDAINNGLSPKFAEWLSEAIPTLLQPQISIICGLCEDVFPKLERVWDISELLDQVFYSRKSGAFMSLPAIFRGVEKIDDEQRAMIISDIAQMSLSIPDNIDPIHFAIVAMALNWPRGAFWSQMLMWGLRRTRDEGEIMIEDFDVVHEEDGIRVSMLINQKQVPLVRKALKNLVIEEALAQLI